MQKKKDVSFFCIAKKDKTLHPSIHYRGLNEITVINKYPLPVSNPTFEPNHGATILTKVHLRNAYHLVCIQEGDEQKMTFNTQLGGFAYLVMPLTDAPAVFDTSVNDVLRDFLNIFVFVYLGNIQIFCQFTTRPQSPCHLCTATSPGKPECEFHSPSSSSVICLNSLLAEGQVKTNLAKIVSGPLPRQGNNYSGSSGLPISTTASNYSQVATSVTHVTSTKIPSSTTYSLLILC